GRMGRGAEAVLEDRVLAVLALACEALLAAVQAARPAEAPVPAAGRLEQVACERSHGAKLRARGQPAGLAQDVRDLRVALELGERRPRPDPPLGDASGHDPLDLDQGLPLDEAAAEQGDELGAAGEQQLPVA